MKRHHDLHHKSYVDGLNKAEQMLAQARQTGDLSLVKHWEREAAFHGSGHLLHAIFWQNLAPAGKGGGGEPQGELSRQIAADFGSFEHFRGHFTAAATQVEGSGWAILAFRPHDRRLSSSRQRSTRT